MPPKKGEQLTRGGRRTTAPSYRIDDSVTSGSGSVSSGDVEEVSAVEGEEEDEEISQFPGKKLLVPAQV